MISIWVMSGSTQRPRRTHRIRIGADRTDCGLPAFFMRPVTTSRMKFGRIPPQFCHDCFRYRYRFLSRPKRGWSRQMTNIKSVPGRICRH